MGGTTVFSRKAKTLVATVASTGAIGAVIGEDSYTSLGVARKSGERD
jgi:hypothetical protein